VLVLVLVLALVVVLLLLLASLGSCGVLARTTHSRPLLPGRRSQPSISDGLPSGSCLRTANLPLDHPQTSRYSCFDPTAPADQNTTTEATVNSTSCNAVRHAEGQTSHTLPPCQQATTTATTTTTTPSRHGGRPHRRAARRSAATRGGCASALGCPAPLPPRWTAGSRLSAHISVPSSEACAGWAPVR
jgi:hypothetical protein